MARILVIDDDDFVCSFIARVLSTDGHTVVTASDGDQGLRRFEVEDFDLVVTDLLMPGKEGIEVIMELRESHPGTPVLAVSGGGGVTPPAGPLQDARLLGADASLAKPFRVEALRRVVSDLLDGRPPDETD